MSCGIQAPNSSALSPRSHPYASSISSEASSSSSSVFSDAASQSSNSSVPSSTAHSTWESEEAWARTNGAEAGSQTSATSTSAFEPIARVNTFPQYKPPTCHQNAAATRRILPPLQTDVPVPPEQRQNPRRTSSASKRPPPPLVRQEERKVNFVDNLVVSATQMVEVIWPLSVPSRSCQEYMGRAVLPLRIFIQETLRRSKTSYSTLQVALYYLILIKSHVPKHDFTMEQPADMHSYRALQCGRRMFLAALILASKYLQDRNYSARAWSKISGLKVDEINTNEMAFLMAVNWKLHIAEPIFERWQEIVLNYTPLPPSSPGAGLASPAPNSWKGIIPLLTPDLDTIELAPRTPVKVCSPPRMPLCSPLSVRTPPSQETTPTPTDYKLPNFLEPRPDMLPPTPTLARMGPLPTPQLTPQSSTSVTPSMVSTPWSRRPSMCSAMQQAQSAAFARSAVDWNWAAPKSSCSEGFPPTIVRRPSAAPSAASLSSSPESMVSDNSSRSSRASSISSVSSASWAPSQTNKLCRLATCRSAQLVFPTKATTGFLPKCKEAMDPIGSSEIVSPDLESFHLDDESTPTTLALRTRPAPPRQFLSSDSLTPLADDAAAVRSRKRGRSSADLSLQQNVRALVAAGSPSAYKALPTVLSDPATAQSFLLQTPNRTPTAPSCSMTLFGPKALQSPKSTVSERRLPVQKEAGRKRTCCAREAARTLVNIGKGRRESVGMM